MSKLNIKVSFEFAKEALGKVLEDGCKEISMQAVKLAKHAGRKTVKAIDIELAVKVLT